MNLPDHKKTNFLTGVRGYAALWVFLIHTSILLRSGHEGQLVDNILNYGGSGIYIFFILSSVTIMLSIHHSKHFTTLGYIIKRFFRIFPVYLVILAVGFALGGNPYVKVLFHSPKYDFVDLFYHVTLLNIFKPEYYSSILAVEKTISMEFIYYFVILFFFFLQKKLKDIQVISMSLLALGIILYYNFPQFHLPFFKEPVLEGVFIFYGLGQVVFSYMFYPTYKREKTTSLLYLILTAFCIFQVEKKIDRQNFLLFWTFVSFFIYQACIKEFWYKKLSSVMQNILSNAETLILVGLFFIFLWHAKADVAVMVGLATGVIFLSAKYRSFASKLLFENKFIMYLGTISYSFYLIHWITFQELTTFFMPKTGTNYILFVGVFLTTLFISSVTYFYIEKPGIALGRKLAKQPISNIFEYFSIKRYLLNFANSKK